MRSAEQVARLIELYQVEVKRLESEPHDTGNVLAWYSCKAAIASLYEELQAARIGNVERIRPNVDRRRRPRKQTA